MYRKIIILLFIIFTLCGCDKIRNLQWVYYDQTGCADPWGVSYQESDVVEYFKQKGIKIYDIKFTNDGIVEYCYSCGCKTGYRINCKVKEKDISVMLSEVFYE